MIKIKWALVFIFILSAFLYFFQLGFSSAWDQDEGQMFAATLEMVKSGEYLTPHLNSAIYFHKPPLYAWLTAILFKLFGFTEFWGRFWAAIFGIMGVGLTYLFGKALYNERVGLLSALIIAVSPLYIILARMGLVDILLTFFITLSLYFFYLAYKNPADKKWLYLFYAAMALGTMTKGPLGIFVPSLSIGSFLFFEKRLGFIKEMISLNGILLYLLIASPWFIIETIREGTYFLQMIFGQFLFSIYLTPMQQHPGPIYYYIVVVLLGFIPWSGFFLPALFKKPHALVLSLFCVMLGIFSLASTKVPGYFLPAFPAMAIITAGFLDKVFDGKNKIGYYFGLIFPALFLFISIWVGLNVKVPPQFSQPIVYLQTLMLFAITGFFLAFLFSFIKPQPIWSIGTCVLTISLFFVGLIFWLVPYAEDYKPSKDLAYSLKGYKHVAFYKTWLPPSLIFYLNRQDYPTVSVDVQDENSLKQFLAKDKSAAYIPESEEKMLKFSHRILKSKAQYAIIAK